jgi:hypothetical protein
MTNENISSPENKRTYDTNPVTFNTTLNDRIDVLNEIIKREIVLKDYNQINVLVHQSFYFLLLLACFLFIILFFFSPLLLKYLNPKKKTQKIY